MNELGAACKDLRKMKKNSEKQFPRKNNQSLRTQL
jgi:hypothetical protein